MSDKSKKPSSLSGAYQDALLRHLEETNRRIAMLEAEVQRLSPGNGPAMGSDGLKLNSLENFSTPMDRLDRLESIVKAHNSELVATNVRIAGMRLDRQFLKAPWFALQRLWPKKPKAPQPAVAISAASTSPQQSVQSAEEATIDVVVVCPVYPGGNRAYGGEFIQKRVIAYRDAGLVVHVLEVNPKRTDMSVGMKDDVEVLRCGLDRAREFMAEKKIRHLAVHQLERPLWDVLSEFIDEIEISVWVHGFEARHWRELEFNYSETELETLEPLLEEVTAERRTTMREVLGEPRVRKIIVSEFMRSVAEDFTEQ